MSTMATSSTHEVGSEKGKPKVPTHEVTAVNEVEEKLRNVRGAVPLIVWLVNVVILLERASYYGVLATFRMLLCLLRFHQANVLD